MELALLRLFQRGGRGNAKIPEHLAESIFQSDPLETRELLIEHGYFRPDVTVRQFVDMLTEYRETRLKADSKRRRDKARDTCDKQVERGVLSSARVDKARAQHELEIREKERKTREAVAFAAVWLPDWIPDGEDPACAHTYWLTCFARVCFAHLLLTLTPRDSRIDANIREKMHMWLDAHIPMLRYMDEEPPRRGDIDIDPARFSDGFEGVRASDYPEDHDMMQVRTEIVANPRRPMPDEVLSEINFDPPTLLDQAADVYRQVKSDPHCDIVEWLVLGTNPDDQEMGDRTGQSQANRSRYPWFRGKHFRDADDVLAHTVWAAVQLQCRALADIAYQGVADKYKDAAYLWQLAFVDLADFCDAAGRYDDEFILTPDIRAEISPLETCYPWPGRAFHEGDLPNLLPTLSIIALRGEQVMPRFDLGRVINKSLPFACMRRLLTDTTRTAIRSSDGFFKLFGKMMQCMLWGTYPGSRKRLDGDTALAVMRLCADRNALVEKLSISEDQSCRIIFTAIRSYVCEYGRLNPAYADACDDVMYWYGMVRDTRRMADTIRETNLRAVDTFAEARIRLERHGKLSDAIVYRYRDRCVSEHVFKTVSKQLEENTYAEMEDARRDIVVFDGLVRELEDNGRTLDQLRSQWERALLTDHANFLEEECHYDSDPLHVAAALRHCIEVNERCIEEYHRAIPKELKENILNMLLHVPENMRFTESCFSQLCLPQFGGMRRSIVHSLVRLVELYHERGAPKDSEEQMSDFSPFELKVVTWFLHCCRLYDRVHLVRLDPVTEERIEQAMMVKRLALYPGVQEIVPNDFMVYVTICCERVITKTNGIYGHGKVRFDLDTQQPVCKPKTKTTKKILADDHEEIWYPTPASTDEEVKERAKAHKLNFIRISCPKPVLRINVRGYRLVMGSRRGTKHQYMHCPQCAAFHEIKTSGYRTKGGYACQQCLARDKTIHRQYKCAYCRCDIDAVYDAQNKCWEMPNPPVRVLRFKEDPSDSTFDPLERPLDIWQRLYFCKKHYASAVAISHQRAADRARGKPARYLDKAELFRRIGRAQMRNAERSKSIKFASRGIARQK